MPLEVRHTASGAVLHQNAYVAADFDVPTLVEASRELDLPHGRASLQHWYFEGLRLGYSRWRFPEPTTTEWAASLDVVHLHVNLRGRQTIAQNESGLRLELANYQHNLSYAPVGRTYVHHAELDAEIFMLQLTRPAFRALIGDAAEATPTPLGAFAARVREGKPALLGAESLPLTLPMHGLIREVLTCPMPTGPLKQLFLRAKAQELLALQADAFQRAAEAGGGPGLSAYDRERLQFARDYLTAHAHLPPTLPELARLAGINEHKLKQGFKALFGLPAFAYLAEWRLQEARLLLGQGRRTASEVAFELGYSSLPHLSAAFKKRFGVSPKELRG